MTKWRHNLEEMRLLGPRKLAYRVWFELGNRTGLRERLESRRVAPFDESAVSSLEDWKAIGAGRWLGQVRESVESGEAGRRLRGWLGEEGVARLIEEADEAIDGRIVCFSRWAADYGTPVDWHLNPRTGKRWPLEHASRVLRHASECGDVKFTWEINRFPHLYGWVRAYALTGDSKWVHAFADQLAAWEAANPYRMGVNWSSGQELAIRLMAWSFAVAAMGGDDAFEEADFRRFTRLAYLHAEHIDANIEYARLAVHNNHLIGEALGLCLFGKLFPGFERSDKWFEKGKKLLLEDCLKQFYADGGYCQSSHTYHRLALHYYLWAYRLGVFEGDPREAQLREVLGRSADYLEHFVNEADGRLPNWGANDGSLLNPWTECDYGDFRPLLTSLRYLVDGSRSFGDGAWDEELFWFFGGDALSAEVRPVERDSRSFEVSGLHILRNRGDDFAAFRCGSVIDRFGQADQLHVDIWHRGKNIAVDGGSYCYNDELSIYRWFKGTSAHNTVTIDRRNQMYLFRKFKWLYWTKAEIVDVRDDQIEGLHQGYEKLNIIHRRRVSALKNGWRVVDWLERSDTVARTFRLHWLLNGEVLSQTFDLRRREWTMEFNAEGIRGVLRIEAVNQQNDLSVLDRSSCRIREAVFQSKEPKVAGWKSRYYGERTPALSINCEIDTDRPVRFISTFEFAE